MPHPLTGCFIGMISFMHKKPLMLPETLDVAWIACLAYHSSEEVQG